MKIFHVKEAIDLGIEKEKKRRDFYDRVAKQFEQKNLKDLFIKLRDWEETHIQKFTGIRDRVAEPEVAQSYPEEFTQYMNVLVDDKLYKQLTSEAFGALVKNSRDAIMYGIGFEKDAILFFNELMPLVTHEKDKEVVHQLIEEEKKHVVYLVEFKRTIDT